MKDADTNQDGMISFIEFLGYFQKMARYRADLARTQRIEAYGQPLDLPPSKRSVADIHRHSCCFVRPTTHCSFVILHGGGRSSWFVQHVEAQGQPLELPPSKHSVADTHKFSCCFMHSTTIVVRCLHSSVVCHSM